MDKNALPFWNPDLPLDERLDDLLSRLTLEEKINQTVYSAPAVERLGIPAYNWWNECLHGVGRAGIATVFPQAIGMAASFDVPLLKRVATIISDEARAKHHEFASRGDRTIYKGLTFWTPNINIFRDPRWGRGQETYGEDPFLTGRMGVAFVQGLQGDDPKYLKLVATPKHYAVHSGPEPLRHQFDARVSPKDMRETYLPHFKECVQEAGAWSIMGAYNRTNGEPCCASPTLLQKVLRDEWGFRGYVVSDCGAIADIHLHHKVVKDAAEAAALAVNEGCDLNCGRTYPALREAVDRNLISEKTIDRSVRRLFEARMRLGMFDPPERVPYAQIPYEVVDSQEHRIANLEMSRQTLVLLKNDDRMLPLPAAGTIAVIGPNAASREVLVGNYEGTPSRPVTLLDGIRARAGDAARVIYAEGCTVLGKRSHWGDDVDQGYVEAEAAASRADVVVLALGLTAGYEGEEGSADWSNAKGDRPVIDLPEVQQRLLERVQAVGKPVVLVLFSGSALSVAWAHEHVRAILQAWYPGGEGGTAVAEALFGDVNPSGRMPVTVVKDLAQLPPFEDYAMRGRTYRYMKADPLYPFGFGLSYSRFVYGEVALSNSVIQAGEPVEVTVQVSNTGERSGGEVVQAYLEDLKSSTEAPRWSLVAFCRVELGAGESTTVTLAIPGRRMALIDEAGRAIVEPGGMRVHVGGSQPDTRSRDLGASPTVAASFTVAGDPLELPY
jgi:beta-glucosidase